MNPNYANVKKQQIADVLPPVPIPLPSKEGPILGTPSESQKFRYLQEQGWRTVRNVAAATNGCRVVRYGVKDLGDGFCCDLVIEEEKDILQEVAEQEAAAQARAKADADAAQAETDARVQLIVDAGQAVIDLLNSKGVTAITTEELTTAAQAVVAAAQTGKEIVEGGK